MSTEFDDTGLRTKPLAYVLDDNLKVRELVSRMLVKCGFIPREFADMNACTRQIRDTGPGTRPNVLVLDLALGRSDAVEVIRQLEKLKFAGKVLLISGSDESTLNKVQQIGVSHGLAMLPCLKKPFRVDELRASLNASVRCQTTTALAETPKISLEQALGLVRAVVPAENRTEGLDSLRRRSTDSGATPKTWYCASRELHAPSRCSHPHPVVEVCDEASDGRLETIFCRSNISIEVSGEYTAIGDRRSRLVRR